MLKLDILKDNSEPISFDELFNVVYESRLLRMFVESKIKSEEWRTTRGNYFTITKTETILSNNDIYLLLEEHNINIKKEH